MYSKNKRTPQEAFDTLTPPPGYDGNRFAYRDRRTDGRDELYESRTHSIYQSQNRQREEAPSSETLRHSQQEDPAFLSRPDDGTDYAKRLFNQLQEASPPQKPSQQEAVPDRCDRCEKQEKEPHAPQHSGSFLPEQLSQLLRGLKRDDFLIIALIILLAGEKSMDVSDLLLLVLLLCTD